MEPNYPNIVGFTLICSLFVYAFRYILIQFSNTQKEIQQEVLQNRELVMKHINTNSLILMSLQKQLLVHDAQVRGINPSVGEDTAERVNLAYDVYCKNLDMMDNIMEKLKDVS